MENKATLVQVKVDSGRKCSLCNKTVHSLKILIFKINNRHIFHKSLGMPAFKYVNLIEVSFVLGFMNRCPHRSVTVMSQTSHLMKAQKAGRLMTFRLQQPVHLPSWQGLLIAWGLRWERVTKHCCHPSSHYKHWPSLMSFADSTGATQKQGKQLISWCHEQRSTNHLPLWGKNFFRSGNEAVVHHSGLVHYSAMAAALWLPTDKTSF